MTLPTLHMNGTPKDGLIGPLCDASSALNDAYEVLKLTSPNGRDYYPQGPDALRKATDEHMARLRKLDEIKREVDELTMAISDEADRLA